jgi:hypothetical protein
MLTEERDTAKREGKIIVLGVEEAKKIFAGSMVALNAAGFAQPASDAAGLVVLGRANKTVDNSAGAAGALQVEIEQGFFLFTSAGLTAADAGKDCYAASDEAVDLTGGTNKVFAGIIAEVVSATECWVKMGLGGKKISTIAEIQAQIEASLPVAAVVAADATAAAAVQGVGYVQADAQTVATLANALQTKVNAILTSLKAAGLMANS